MLRCTILVVLLADLAFAATEDDNSTSTTPVPATSTASVVVVNVPQNKTKDGVGKGHGHDGGRRYRGRHEDHDYYHRDEAVHPFPDVKSYFDTHYCSVHGSFALSFNEKVEEDDSYSQSSGGNSYGAPPSGYGSSSQAYGSGGYSSGGGGGGSYSSGGGSSPSYGEDGGYSKRKEKETKFVRKITRQYCRYTASWSDKACKFCCRVVARSAYTNPDDITAAIFSFDPANPSAGGAGIEVSKSHGSSSAPTYGAPPSQSYAQEENYNQGAQYGGQNAYQQGGQQGYEQQNGGANYNQGQYQGAPPPPPTYQQPPPPPPPAYTGNNPQYRSKRSNGYGFPAPPTEYVGSDATSYSTPGDYENEVEEAKTVNQCVCCAPKHRFY
ncbi:hypothetical protein M3Y99_00882800 [Aphelenchoides fujianensis]|nr:hypothetical protein M3Y99_00882800 [Aphelenchoides fujianensis]